MNDARRKAFAIAGFLLSDSKVDGFARQGVPDERFFAGGERSDALPAWYQFFDLGGFHTIRSAGRQLGFYVMPDGPVECRQ